MEKPGWMSDWLWHPLTWAVHGLIQYSAFNIDPGFGWGLLPMWFYREKWKDHRGNSPDRWPLDGWMDVLTPIVVQVVCQFL